MSPIQPSKRRRLNTATNTLSQPFKSPLKTPLKSKPDTHSPTQENPTSPKQDSATTETISPPPSAPRPAPTTITTPLRRALPHQHKPPSPEHLTLQKRHTHLLNQLSAARAALETSTQALKIESSTRDAELQVLIAKWKGASRAAAEEVFARARDKVNRMGGVGAMRERERERDRMVGSYGWDEGPVSKSRNEDGDGDGEGEGEDGAGFRARVGEEDGTGFGRMDAEEVDEREEGARGVQVDDDGDGGEEEEEGGGYTMDLMLKSLNVDLGVIGFDKGLQKWVD